MSKRNSVGFVALCLSLVPAFASAQQLTITLETLPGQTFTPGGTFRVEAFIQNNGADFSMLGYQIDLPCSLIGKAASSGAIETTPGGACTANTDCPANDAGTGNIACAAGPAPRFCNSLNVGNTSASTSGSVPWMFASVPPNTSADDPAFLDNGGLRPIAQAACRLAGAPSPGEPAYTLPAGAKRYLGTFRYKISACASGTFNIPYDVVNTPCQVTDLTRVVDSNSQCISANFTPRQVVVAGGGRCCTAGTCEESNAACCATAGGTFTLGANCDAGCPCGGNPECQDGIFCNGAEVCQGTCQPATNPNPCVGATPFCREDLDSCVQCLVSTDCPDDGNPCTTSACSPAGVCEQTNNTDPCDDGIFCNGVDACLGGVCVHPGDPCAGGTECANLCNEAADNCFRPSGTACGDPSDTTCTDPDTCNATGVCLANNVATNPVTACESDDNPCTLDRCRSGRCDHDPMAAGSACGDSADNECTNPDTCSAAGVCEPNNEPDGATCTTDNNVCTTDACAAGVCAHAPVPVGTMCGSSTDTDCDNPDTCDAAGVCQTRNEPDGTACTSDGVECTSDVCASGACAHPPSAAGTACGNPANTPPCNLADTCNGAGVCSPNTAPNGTTCSDGLFCTGVDACQGGACVGGPSPCSAGSVCDENTDMCGPVGECQVNGDCPSDNNECTNEICVNNQCMNQAKPGGTACGDPTVTACDGADTCSPGGDCLDNLAAVNAPCGDPTDDDCDNPDTCDGLGTCQPNSEPNGTDCSDTIFCDGEETCLNGACPTQGPPVDCGVGMVCNPSTDMCEPGPGCVSDTQCPGDPNNPCVRPRCITGSCTFENLPNGTACSDGQFCTGANNTDVCTAGVCGGAARNCADALECTIDSCDEAADTCRNLPKAVGTACGSQGDSACDNPNTCNAAGACANNFEPAGTACGSPTDNDCTNPDTCNGAGVCQSNDATNGTACEDGQFCTTGEGCLNGTCGGGVPLTCNDSVACTTDSCNETTNACVNTVTAGNCLIDGVCRTNGTGNPQNACEVCNASTNQNDWTSRPAGTACGSSSNTDCDNPDTCDANGTCLSNNETDGTTCTADANECSLDVCDSGICIHPFAPIGTPCGSPTNVPPCNLADTCNGLGACQGNTAPNGTSCADSQFCNGQEVCRGGVCSDNDDPCRSLNHCNEANDTCVTCIAPSECDDGNVCTTDACTAGACVNTPVPNCIAQSQLRGSGSKKGSLLVYPDVEVKWIPVARPNNNAVAGGGPAVDYVVSYDTFLDLTNDFPNDVYVQLYFVNGDAALPPVFVGSPPVMIERAHRGWNWVDCSFLLTSDQPTYFSVFSGLPVGCQPWTVLDPGFPPGRPDPEVQGGRTIRGFVLAWAVDRDGNEIRWNHLKGDAALVDYARGSVAEYNAFAFQAVGGVQGGWPDATRGQLLLDGVEYENAFERLLFDFYAANSIALSSAAAGRTVLTETDLTLQVLTADLRQDTEGPVATKAQFDIWNQNEIRLSGTTRCVTCWDQALLRNYGTPNNLLRSNLQTDKGKARIDGTASPAICPDSVRAPLLGVAVKTMTFLQGEMLQGFAEAAMTLVGEGRETAIIKYDVISGPGEAVDDSLDPADVRKDDPAAPIPGRK